MVLLVLLVLLVRLLRLVRLVGLARVIYRAPLVRECHSAVRD